MGQKGVYSAVTRTPRQYITLEYNDTLMYEGLENAKVMCAHQRPLANSYPSSTLLVWIILQYLTRKTPNAKSEEFYLRWAMISAILTHEDTHGYTLRVLP